MVKHIEVAVVQADGEAPTWYQYIIRGVDKDGYPFVDTDGESTFNDFVSLIQTALVTNAVQWGIHDDIT